jgi:flavin reductase (DIM6/NTAB) family NADH-FMN oxidoreductase RutF
MSSFLTPSRLAMSVAPEAQETSLPVDLFKKAFRNHPAGVALVVGDPGEHPVALTVSSLSSISTEPPLMMFSVSAQSSSSQVLQDVETVVVHMLGAAQLELAQLGAMRGVDRFADTNAWLRLPTGEPVFLDVDAWIRGRVVHRLEAGNSTVYVIHALDAAISEQAEGASAVKPLVYHNRVWHRLDARSAIS